MITVDAAVFIRAVTCRYAARMTERWMMLDGGIGMALHKPRRRNGRLEAGCRPVPVNEERTKAHEADGYPLSRCRLCERLDRQCQNETYVNAGLNENGTPFFTAECNADPNAWGDCGWLVDLYQRAGLTNVSMVDLHREHMTFSRQQKARQQ